MPLQRDKLSSQILDDPTMTEHLKRQYNKTLQKHMKRLRGHIDEAYQRAGGRTLSSLIEQGFFEDEFNRGVRIGIDSERPKIEPTVNKYSGQAYESGLARAEQWLVLQGYAPITLPADPLALQAVKDRNLSSLMKVEDDMADAIKAEVSAGLRGGESAQEVQERIMGRITHIGEARAELVAREETRHAYRTARDQRYRESGVKRVEWLTAGDDRVCGICEPLDFSTHDVGDEPDAHPRCRCETVPIEYEGGIQTQVYTSEDF